MTQERGRGLGKTAAVQSKDVIDYIHPDTRVTAQPRWTSISVSDGGRS